MPAIQPKVTKKIEESNRKIIIEGKAFSDFTMGADPEIRFKGINADQLGIKGNDKFGLDGCSSTGELRPTPQYCPLNLTNVIEQTLKSGYFRYPKTRDKIWLAGSNQDNAPIGGHIHFGSDYKDAIDLKINSLNALCAPVSLMLENGEQAKARRRSHNYGSIKKGNRCYDEHPEYGGFEYRPLASWLVSRNYCAGILSLAKVCVFDAHNKELREGLAQRLKFLPIDAEYETNFLECNKIFFIKKIPTIYRVLSKLTLFPKYEKYINFLFNQIHQGRTWDDDQDLKFRWNIVPKNKIVEKEVKKTKVSLDSIMSGTIAEIPF